MIDPYLGDRDTCHLDGYKMSNLALAPSLLLILSLDTPSRAVGYDPTAPGHLAAPAFDSQFAPNQLHWFLLGGILVLLVYHLFLLFSLREASYLYFVLFLTSLFFGMSGDINFPGASFSPDLDAFRPHYIPLVFSLLAASILLFSDAFLELKTRLPRYHWVSLGFVASWGGLVLLVPFLSSQDIARLMASWAFVSLGVVGIAGIAAWKKDFHPARFFMAAWLGMALSVFLGRLARLGIVPSPLFGENSYLLGFMFLAVGWSIAQADRLYQLKAETERANRNLQNSEYRLSQILDGMPLGVVVYGKDQKPKYHNKRSAEILGNPAQGSQPDLSFGRTLARAIQHFSFKVAGNRQEYPLENFPVFSALQGEPASADDIEIDRGNQRIPLEMWASPVRDEAGSVESAVAAFHDITPRKGAEAELVKYRKHLEALVEKRTAELMAVNEQLQLRLDWQSAIIQINQIMAGSADFTNIYAKITEIINHLFSSQDSFIAEIDPGRKGLKILAHSCRSGNDPDLIGSVTSLPEPFLSNPDIQPGNLTLNSINILSSLSGPLGGHIRVAQIHTIVLVPLRLRERVLGFLGLEMHEIERSLTRDESSLLTVFSTDVAQLIENSHLYEQTRALIAAEERNRLARDLHDSVTQVLFSASLLAEVLPQIWRRDPDLGLQRLDKLQRLTRGALAEMRTMLLELRPSAVVKTPLGELLAQLTEAVASRSGLPFRLFIEQIPPLPEEVHMNFYRIAQEALNNVVKHAQAKVVTVSLSVTPLQFNGNGVTGHEVRLVIQDDGVGFFSGNGQFGHLGIGIMRERAAAIQAALSLESQPGYGTLVSLTWFKEPELEKH